MTLGIIGIVVLGLIAIIQTMRVATHRDALQLARRTIVDREVTIATVSDGLTEAHAAVVRGSPAELICALVKINEQLRGASASSASAAYRDSGRSPRP